jgi:hypothetical protein
MNNKSIFWLAVAFFFTNTTASPQNVEEPTFLADPREEYGPYILFLPDGQTVFYASRRLRTGEVEFATGKPIWQNKLAEPALLNGLPPWAIRLHPKKQMVITTDVKFWDARSGQVRLNIPVKSPATAIDISDDQNLVVLVDRNADNAYYFSSNMPEKQTLLSRGGVYAVTFRVPRLTGGRRC